MAPAKLYQLSGLAAILAGISFITDTLLDLFFPGNGLGIGIFVSLLGLHGLTGLFLFQREKGGMLNLVGYFLNFTGLAALIGIAFANNFILSQLQTAVIQELFSGSLLIIFISIGITYLMGALLFSTALWRSHQFSRTAIAGYALGSIPVAMPNVFPIIVTSIGGILVGLSIGWLGWQLIQLQKALYPTMQQNNVKYAE